MSSGVPMSILENCSLNEYIVIISQYMILNINKYFKSSRDLRSRGVVDQYVTEYSSCATKFLSHINFKYL